jgi:histidine phosphotransfer protein HptB
MTHAGTDSGYLYSPLGADPDLADIVEMFVQELPQRLEALRDHLNKGDWQGLRQLAHQMKGAAGSYGFDVVSPVAGKVESAVRDNEPEEQIRAAVAELTDLCSLVRCGPAPSQE